MRNRVFHPLMRRWPTADSDPYWDNVVLLMHMDTTDFVDEKGHTVTKSNNPPVETGLFSNAIRFAQSAGRQLSVANSGSDFNFTAGSYTVEFALKPYSYPVCGGFNLLFIGNHFAVAVEPTAGGGKVRVGTYTGITWTYHRTADDVIITNQYNHIAVVVNGSNIKIFVNGEQEYSAAYTAPNTYTGEPILLGNSNNIGICDISAAMDELRITKGVARYTADFTPPDAPFHNQ